MILVQHFFHKETFTLTYVVYDEQSLDGIIIDPVLDYDQASGVITDVAVKEIVQFITNKKIKPLALLETHAHADHLSSSQVLKKIYPELKICISESIKVVQEVFKEVFNLENLKTDASQFDILMKDFHEYSFGTIKFKAIPTPGHTPACMSFYFININSTGFLFSGDALFMPDSGTGRCDFPKGSAKELYQSISKNIYSLPDETIIYVGHDYSPNGRELLFKTTIGESKNKNIQLKASTKENEYVEFRQSRDKTLSAPKLLLPSIQINIDAGHLPHPEKNGVSYLKMPLKTKF